MGVKRGVMLNLTDEYVQELKARGINISREVDRFLDRRLRAIRKAEPTHLGRVKPR